MTSKASMDAREPSRVRTGRNEREGRLEGPFVNGNGRPLLTCERSHTIG